MPRVSINCPACKRSLKPAEDPPPGARMRCPYGDCGTVFHYDPAANGAAKEAPALGDVAPPEDSAGYDLLNELLAEDDGPAPSKSKPIPRSTGAAQTSGEEFKLPPPGAKVPELPRLSRSGSRGNRQPVPGHPLAQSSEASKQALVGGKGVKFNEPRTYMGVLIAFLILAAGYGGFLAFATFWSYYNNAAKRRADDIASKAKEAEDVKKKKFDDAVAKLQPKQNAAAAPNAPTPAPAAAAANIAALAVTVESVRQGLFFPPDQRQFLEVILRITNESKVANHTATWPGPKVVARLRGTGFVPYQLYAGPAQDVKLTSGQSVHETIYFERTVPGHELTLELTIPAGVTPTKKQFTIPPADVKHVP